MTLAESERVMNNNAVAAESCSWGLQICLMLRQRTQQECTVSSVIIIVGCDTPELPDKLPASQSACQQSQACVAAAADFAAEVSC